MKRKLFLGTVASILMLGFAQPTFAKTLNQLVRCSDTTFSTGFYGSYYSMSCGGDSLTRGFILTLGTRVAVILRGALADPFNLYEVYWMPIGGDPSSSGDIVKIGNVVTDCNGDTAMLVRPLTKATDVGSAAPADLSTLVGTQSAGTFWLYSRGPMGNTDNGSCRPTYFNTVVSPNDTDPSNAFANPVVVTDSDNVQFISGFAN